MVFLSGKEERRLTIRDIMFSSSVLWTLVDSILVDIIAVLDLNPLYKDKKLKPRRCHDHVSYYKAVMDMAFIVMKVHLLAWAGG